MDSLLDFDDHPSSLGSSSGQTTTLTVNGHVKDPFDFDLDPFAPTETKHTSSATITTIRIGGSTDPFGNFDNLSQTDSKRVESHTYQNEFELLGDFTNSSNEDSRTSWKAEEQGSWSAGKDDNSYLYHADAEGNDNNTQELATETSKLSGFQDSDYEQHSTYEREQPAVDYFGSQHSDESSFNKSDPKQVSRNSYEREEVNNYSDDFDPGSRRRGLEEIRNRSYEEEEGNYHVSNTRSHQAQKNPQADKAASMIYVYGATADNICKQCNKRVYEMEKVTVDNTVYHKSCFRCATCNRTLTLGTYSAVNGQMYCKADFLKNFKVKGNYTDSFAAAKEMKLHGDDISNEGGDSERDGSRSSVGDWRQQQQQTRDARDEYNDYDNTDYNDDEVQQQQQQAREEIPTIPLKSVRNMFEKLAHDTPPSSGQQLMSAKKEMKPTQPRATTHVEITTKMEQAREGDARESEESRRKSSSRDASEERKSKDVVVSSNVYVIEDELPPPAFTKNILAKFKMMENVGETAKVPAASSRTGTQTKNVTASKVVMQTKSQTHENEILSSKSSVEHKLPSEQYQRQSSGVVNGNHGSAEDVCDQPGSIEVEHKDDLPQAGLARSLLAQWRNLEENSCRGRDREVKKMNSARRSQSMSRFETVQRARVYANDKLPPATSKEEGENFRGRVDSEVSEDELPPAMVTRQRLAQFKDIEAESRVTTTYIPKPKQVEKTEKSFKWQVKEAIPLNRGTLIVHGDVPKRPDVQVRQSSEEEIEHHLHSHQNREQEENRREEFEYEDDNVARGDYVTVINEDELPPPATTRTLLERFKAMEDPSKAPPIPKKSTANASSFNSTKRGNLLTTRLSNDPMDSEVDGKNDRVVHSVGSDSGEFENEPVRGDPGLVREGDRSDEVELPSSGTTRNLLAKFQSLQSK